MYMSCDKMMYKWEILLQLFMGYVPRLHLKMEETLKLF